MEKLQRTSTYYNSTSTYDNSTGTTCTSTHHLSTDTTSTSTYNISPGTASTSTYYISTDTTSTSTYYISPGTTNTSTYYTNTGTASTCTCYTNTGTASTCTYYICTGGNSMGVPLSPTIEVKGRRAPLTVKELWMEQQEYRRARERRRPVNSQRTFTNRRNISRYIDHLVYSGKVATVEAAIAYVQNMRDRLEVANSTDKLWKYCKVLLRPIQLAQLEEVRQMTPEQRLAREVALAEAAQIAR
ncbi:hypothetical protein DFQ26_001609 [Actinomortierella ambigua]|nr:hypothetical protein DFQ26_001609 [Actinomortierella ambigua]